MAEQSNISNNSNQAVYGMNTDNVVAQVKPGTLTYALNAQVDSFDGQMVSYQNEQSNVLCSEFKTGYKVIGHHQIVEQKRTVIFMVNPSTGDSEVGILDNKIVCDVDDPTNLGLVMSTKYVNNGYNNEDCTVKCESISPEVLTFYELYRKLHPIDTEEVNTCCTYTTVINAKCLNFNINNPIHKAVHRIVGIKDDGKCGTEIYWADGLNPRRFINLDDLPLFEEIVGCDRIKSNVVDCDLLEVQPTVTIPCVQPLVVTDGGSLIAGDYQFAIQYTNERGEGYTSYYSVANPVGIFQQRFGLDYNFPTDKSIKLLITGLDLKFQYFNLAVIKTINGVADPELVGTYEILKDSIEVSYSGANKTQINLTIEDIFQKSPYYNVASDVTSAGGLLMWSNLKSIRRLNYQSIANRIHLQWGTTQIPYNQAQGYANGANTALYRGYMRDEVYAFEIVFILKNGQQTDGFHIPGRAAISSDLTATTGDDLITKELDNCVVDGNSQPKWKVYNTGTKIGQEASYIAAADKNCYVGPYEYGEFAYWESEKKYPCNEKIWGNLADKPIRHHKFPDSLITHIHDNNPSSSDQQFEHKIFPIGVRLDLNNIKQAIIQSDLTDYEKRQIIGYRIIRSDRVNNKSVIAKGLLYNIGAYTPVVSGSPVANQESFYPNYPFNDLGDDPFLTNLASVGDGGSGFSLTNLSIIDSQLQNAMSSLDAVAAKIITITPIAYSATGIIPPTAGPAIIQITGSEIANLQNLIFVAKNAGDVLTEEIQTISDYFNQKIQSGGVICQSDVTALTIVASHMTDFLNALSAIDSSAAITNFKAIVLYITTNATTLNSHPNSNDIFKLRTDLQAVLSAEKEIPKENIAITNAYDDYNDDLTALSSVSCTPAVGNVSAFSRSRFTFHSPDTSFYQPFLGTILKFETLEGGSSIGNFVQVKDHAGHKMMTDNASRLAYGAGFLVGSLFALNPKAHVIGAVTATYTLYFPDFPDIGTIADKGLYWSQQFKILIDNIIPYKNYAYQYNAIGIYNQFQTIPNTGHKQRGLDKAYYLLPGYQALGDTFTINNWKRESSVYFRTDQTKSAPYLPNDALIIGSLVEDDSRVAFSGAKQIYSHVLSYYASHKRRLTDQYGDIYTYGVVDTGYCGKFDLNQSYTNQTDNVFGGDIFINRFGLKRKLSYYIDTAVGRPDGVDINYDELSNIGKTKYWYNSTTTTSPGSGFKNMISAILGVPRAQFDGTTNKFFYQDGRIYLYSYGIAYFFVESEVNVDFRQAGNELEKNFYPNVGTGIPNDWLQEVNVPIVQDNYYIYNKTYSKQNKENFFTHLPITFNPDDTCLEDYSHRIIYSDPNKWRIYKPISYFEFPKNYGKLISVDTIDNTQILVRFENKTYIYNALTAIQTSSGKYAYLGNDDVFKVQPIDFGETDQGYAGSQHHFLLRTEAGHLFIDSLRAQVFLVNGSSVIPISDAGLSKWFTRNLPFNITKVYPDINIDNHFNGIGITGIWDSIYNRFIITKLDYEPHPEFKNLITYDSYFGRFIYKGNEVLLEDSKYFCNKSWTISFSPGAKSWISFHSYIPNYYIGNYGIFMTGKNSIFNNQKSSVWIHNLIHTSYQRFYGKLEPYILEYPFAFKANDEIIQDVQDYTSIYEYYNENDFYEINDNVWFNKAILYNGQQTSGVLNLYPKPKGKLNLYFNYPKYNTDSKDIIYTKSDNIFKYNTFWDVVKNANNHNPIWIESCENKSVDKVLNNDKLDYSTRSHQKTKLRAKDLKIRHINDRFDRYKFLSRFINTQTQASFK